MSKTVFTIVNLYDYDGNTDAEVLGVFETLDEAKEQLRVQYRNAMISVLADYAGVFVDPKINDEELDDLAEEHLYCNWCTAVQAVVSSADNYTDQFFIRESTFNTTSGVDVPVAHARWEINPDGYYPYCSNCKAEPKSGKMTPTCPSCGAKMDD